MKPRTITAYLLALYLLAAAIEPADGAELYAQGGLAAQSLAGRGGLWCDGQRDRLIGHIELGASHTVGRWSAALYVRHESLPRLGDMGVNSIGIQSRITLWSNRR